MGEGGVRAVRSSIGHRGHHRVSRGASLFCLLLQTTVPGRQKGHSVSAAVSTSGATEERSTT